MDAPLNITFDANGDIDRTGEVSVSIYSEEDSQAPLSTILSEYSLDSEGRMVIFSQDSTFRELLPFSDEVSGEVFVEVEYVLFVYIYLWGRVNAMI